MSKKNTTKNKSNHAKRMAKKQPVATEKTPDPKKVAKEKKEATKSLLKKIFTIVVSILLILLFALPSLSGLMSCTSKQKTDSDYTKKVEKLQSSIEENSEDMQAYIDLADLYLEWGRGIYNGTVQDSEYDTTSLCTLAASYYAQYGDATDPEVELNLATAYAYAGSYDEATEIIDALIEADDTNAGAWAMRGYVLSQQGDPDNAEVAFQKAVDLDPKSDAGEFAQEQLDYLGY